MQCPTSHRHDLANSHQFNVPLYPWMFVNLGGGVLEAGPRTGGTDFTGWLDTTTWRWVHSSFRNNARDAGWHLGSAVCYSPGKYMRCAGGHGEENSDKTAILDIAGGSRTWEPAGDMEFGRRHIDLVLLPDYKAVVIGGNTESFVVGATSRRRAEVFDFETETWTTDPSTVHMDEGRGYHSTAVLLPDARVFVAGGEEGLDGATFVNGRTAQIYRPAYLSDDPPRVDLDHSTAPKRLVYGKTHSILCTMAPSSVTEYDVVRVCLIKLGSVTHSFDQDQRFINLDFSATVHNPDPDGDSPSRMISFSSPASPGQAPPGPYMLFVLTEAEGQPHAGVEVPCNLAAHVLLGDERILVDIAQLAFIAGAHPHPDPDPNLPQRQPTPRGVMWNPDNRGYEIAPASGDVHIQVLSEEVPTGTSLAGIFMRVMSHGEGGSAIAMTIELRNHDTSQWVQIYSDQIRPGVNWLSWAGKEIDPDDYVDNNNRIHARIRWQGDFEMVWVHEITWMLRRDH